MATSDPPPTTGPTRAPTMIDVARHADVSLKTVSRYVNGETNIDPQLAGRIAEAISSLGYRRNLQAASIRPGWTSKVLGLIISDLANPYYSSLARAVESVAWAQGYLLTTVSSEEDGARHDRAIDRLIEQRVDALLVVPPRNAARGWDSVTPPVPPVVFIDRPSDHPAADTVLSDNRGGARSATLALAEAGARRVAFVGDAPEIYTMRERYAGYLDALDHVGLPRDDQLVFGGAHSIEQAQDIIQRILGDDRADAIFAANNRAALGALHAFSHARRRLPIVAFDEVESATLVSPALSVVAQDVVAMGEQATRLTLSRIATPSREPVSVTLPTQLILRGSERT